MKARKKNIRNLEDTLQEKDRSREEKGRIPIMLPERTALAGDSRSGCRTETNKEREERV
jgi:hypothetical protein